MTYIYVAARPACLLSEDLDGLLPLVTFPLQQLLRLLQLLPDSSLQLQFSLQVPHFFFLRSTLVQIPVVVVAVVVVAVVVVVVVTWGRWSE